jgi:ABC-type sugar transport system permease subunit
MTLKTNILTNPKAAPYIFLSPFFILFLVFGLYPIGFSIFISFWRWQVRGPVEFVGLRNYMLLLTSDPFFLRSLLNTFWLLIFGSLTQHLIAIPLAIMLNDVRLKGKEFFKTAFFVPYITSTVSATLIFTQIFDENFGWMNYIIEFLGGDPVNWFTSATPAKVMIASLINWRFIGWNTIIYLAGLQAIPRELYEAADVDGANRLQTHMKITVPLLVPIIFFGVTLSIIGGMQIFDEPYVLMGGYATMGGVGNTGLTSAYYLMFTGWSATRFGKASAIAWLMFAIIVILTIVNRMVTKRLDKRD